MTAYLIDNGKTPDELCNFKLGFWLPPDSPYGNFQVKLMMLSERIDEANRRLIDSSKYWEQFISKSKVGEIDVSNSFNKHKFANEQAIYSMRRAADEIISIVWCLMELEKTKEYPNQIDVDCIGKMMEDKKCKLYEYFQPHISVLNSLNEISNAFKHSFINTSISHIIGKDEPSVYALPLKLNNLKNDTQLKGVSLRNFIKEFNQFYNHGMDWLKEFSKRNIREQENRPENRPGHSKGTGH